MKISKKFFLLVPAILLTGIVFADSVKFKNLSTPVTVLATTVGNTTTGTNMYFQDPVNSARIYLSASGIGATTAGTLTVNLTTASGEGAVTTNRFDTASPIQLVLSNSLANTTGCVSSVHNLTGVTFLRVQSMTNTYLGVVSNILVQVSYPSTSSRRP